MSIANLENSQIPENIHYTEISDNYTQEILIQMII